MQAAYIDSRWKKFQLYKTVIIIFEKNLFKKCNVINNILLTNLNITIHF